MKKKTIILVSAVIGLGIILAAVCLFVLNQPVEVRLEKANLAIEQENYDKAERYYSSILKEDENNIQALLGLGLVKVTLGIETEGIQYFDKVIKLDPKNTVAWKEYIEIKQKKEVDKVLIKKMYEDAFAACGDKVFQDWITEHTPNKAAFTTESGTYSNNIELFCESESLNVTYKCSQLGIKEFIVFDKPIQLNQEGTYTFQIKNQNEYGLETITEANYTITYPNEIVSFIDPILESIIRNETGVEVGDIYQKDLRKLTELTLDNLNIKNLEGLQFCSNLKTLWCDGNPIEDYTPVSSLLNLKAASFNYAELGSLEFLKPLENLEELIMGEAQFNSLTGISELKKLKKIIVEKCNINDISYLSEMNDLEELNISRNPIRDISPLKDAVNLKILLASECGLNDISSLCDCTKMTNLILINNDLTNIEVVSNMSNLEVLALMGNQIENINPVSNLTNLKQLIVYGNKVTELGAIMNLSNIEMLSLGNNPIESLIYFNDMKKLKLLDLSSIQSTVIPYSLFATAPNLEQVYLNDSFELEDVDANTISAQISH